MNEFERATQLINDPDSVMDVARTKRDLTEEELEELDLMDAEYWKEKYQESIETSNQ